MTQYAGIIDMEGLDSFAKIEPREELIMVFSMEPGQTVKSSIEPLLKVLEIRARFNEGKHAVPFVCEMDEEAVRMMEAWDNPLWQAQVVLRNSSKVGIASGYRRHWEILKKLVNEFQGEPGERYKVRTLKSLQGSN